MSLVFLSWSAIFPYLCRCQIHHVFDYISGKNRRLKIRRFSFSFSGLKMKIGVFNFSIKVSLNNFVTTTFFKNLRSQNSSQDVYLSVVGLKLVIYTHHRMLLSSSFCNQFAYIKVLLLDVTYLSWSLQVARFISNSESHDFCLFLTWIPASLCKLILLSSSKSAWTEVHSIWLKVFWNSRWLNRWNILRPKEVSSAKDEIHQ